MVAHSCEGIRASAEFALSDAQVRNVAWQWDAGVSESPVFRDVVGTPERRAAARAVDS